MEQKLFEKKVKKSPEEIQKKIDYLLSTSAKFREKIDLYGKEWEQLYKNNPITASEFAKKYKVKFGWIPLYKYLFGLKIVRYKSKKKGGDTMAEVKNTNQQPTTSQPEAQSSSQQPVSQPAQQPVSQLVSITQDIDTLAEVFYRAQQKLIEIRKKQREEELKKKQEIENIKAEGKKELIQKLIDRCKLDPNAPECRGLNFNNEEQVIDRIAQLVDRGREIPVITPKLRGQILRESILGNPKRVSEIIDELYERNPEAIKQLFNYCADGKCSVELSNILKKKMEETKQETQQETKQETQQETPKKRLLRS